MTCTGSTRCHTRVQDVENKTVAIVGCGVVGRNWALIFLRAGWLVRVFDPDPNAEAKLRRALTQLCKEVPEFFKVSAEAISFHVKLSEAVQGAIWVQESAPDRIDLKRKLYQTVQAHSSPNTLIASSSETLAVSDVQAFTNRSRNLLIVRPTVEGFATNQVTIIGAPSSPRSLLVSVSEFLIELGLQPEVKLA